MALPPQKHNQQSRGESAVRVSALERTLATFNLEIGMKMAASLAQYDAKYVAPLRRRLAELDAPWWERLWYTSLRPILELYGLPPVVCPQPAQPAPKPATPPEPPAPKIVLP